MPAKGGMEGSESGEQGAINFESPRWNAALEISEIRRAYDRLLANETDWKNLHRRQQAALDEPASEDYEQRMEELDSLNERTRSAIELNREFDRIRDELFGLLNEHNFVDLVAGLSGGVEKVRHRLPRPPGRRR